jgi:iron complex outermembrane receptor protein
MKLKGPNFQLSNLAQSALIACSAGASLVAVQPVMAQTTLERVEIVGSNIKRVAKEGAVPVVVITKEDIAKTGATTVQELVKNLGISGGQQINTGSSGSFVTGASAAGFRGLPATDTLVLFNGRRIAPYGRSEQTSSGGAVAFVDLNSLPLSAVEQVQILKDGASAIYGADAVAGVMNIITKKNYTGNEASITAGMYSASGGEDIKANATLGFGDYDSSGYNALISLEKSNTRAIWNNQRDFTKTYDNRGYRSYLSDGRSSYSDYGNWDADFGGLSAGSNCPPALLRGGLCRYDFGNVEQVQPETDRTSGMFVGNFKLTNQIKAFAEAAFNRNVTKSASRAPALDTATDFTQVDSKRGLTLGTTHDLVAAALAARYNLLGTDPLGLGTGLTTLDMRQRFTEFGPRTDEVTTDSTRLVLGLKGSLDSGWDWEGAYLSSEQKVTDIAANEINKELMADLLISMANPAALGVTNLFTNSTAKGGYDSTRYVGSEQTISKLTSFDFKMSGELLKLPAGPLGVAFGAELRNEKMNSNVDPVTRAGLKMGSASVETSGKRDVNAMFAELSIPLTSTIESQVALRTERYSDFGNTTNPKFAIRFQPSSQLMFRASAGKAFKAPTLFQLYEGQSAGGYEELVDTPVCLATGIPVGPLPGQCDDTSRLMEVRSGGVVAQGLTLNPEKSTNYNLGMVWSPSANFNIGIDMWRIHKTDAIIKADAQTLIDNNSPAVLRNATVGGVPGSIIRVTSTYFNANQQDLSGIDLDVNAKTKLGAGVLGGGVSMTYNTQFDQITNGEKETLLDHYVYFIVPRFRAQLRGTYDIGAWTTAAYLNYTPGVQNDGTAQTQLDDYRTVDLFASYAFSKTFTMSGGVRNLMDKPPVAIAGIGAPPTDTSLYDMRGRYFYLNANYKF